MSRRWVLVGFVMATLMILSAFIYLWIAFHSIPTEADLQTALRTADSIEIIAFAGGAPDRYTKLEGSNAPQRLAELLTYQGRYWAFGSPPKDALLIQTFQGNQRTGAFEAREDNHIYIRKAVRWYRMSVEPAFRAEAAALLAANGQPLPEEVKREFQRRQVD